jgi:hypothetical protein
MHEWASRHFVDFAQFQARMSTCVQPDLKGRVARYDLQVGNPARFPSDRRPEQMKRPSSGEPRSNSGKDTDMFKSRAHDWRIMPRTVALAAVVLLGAAGVRASAAMPGTASAIPVALFGSSPSVGQPVFTSRGPAFVTGHVGSMDTVMLPGTGGQGFLMNNGNGSSTIFATGSIPQTVMTPR